MKKAFVTGSTSQDASYLFELLLEKGYEVYGLIRRSASRNLWRIEHLVKRIELVQGDMTDQPGLGRLINTIRPDEIYNLAAQSFVQYSFQAPVTTCDITGMGTLNLLEAVRMNHIHAKVFQASTSEQFGKIVESPQKETTRFYPRSPYGCAKAFAHYISVNYRESYGMKISCAIMFNHESPRRGEEFVTRKITKGIAEYKKGKSKLALGNLNASRDWSHAKDMMQGAWLMLQQANPDYFVLASGRTHTVKQWLELACEYAGVDFWDVYLQDPTFERQSEVDYLCGDASKANRVLGWKPTVSFEGLVKEMVDADETLANYSGKV